MAKQSIITAEQKAAEVEAAWRSLPRLRVPKWMQERNKALLIEEGRIKPGPSLIEEVASLRDKGFHVAANALEQASIEAFGFCAYKDGRARR